MSKIQHFQFWNQTISLVTLFCTVGSIGVIDAGIGIGGAGIDGDGFGVKGDMMGIRLLHKIGGGGGVIGAGIGGGCWC